MVTTEKSILDLELEDLEGVGPTRAKKLMEAGISSVVQLATASADRFGAVDHLGHLVTEHRWFSSCNLDQVALFVFFLDETLYVVHLLVNSKWPLSPPFHGKTANVAI